jgi:hypothetical protein
MGRFGHTVVFFCIVSHQKSAQASCIVEYIHCDEKLGSSLRRIERPAILRNFPEASSVLQRLGEILTAILSEVGRFVLTVDIPED